MPTTLIIIIAVVVLLVLWFIAVMNKLVTAKLNVEEAFSGMDIYLKKRYDLIPNLVATVKGYCAHERETLEAVIGARNIAANANRGSVEEVAAAEKQLSSAMDRLMMVVEQYPNLKADTQFTALQAQLVSLENDIAQSRKYYSGAVKQYNLLIQRFPSSIVAAILGHRKAAYFEVTSEHERENVTVDFSK